MAENMKPKGSGGGWREKREEGDEVGGKKKNFLNRTIFMISYL